MSGTALHSVVMPREMTTANETMLFVCSSSGISVESVSTLYEKGTDLACCRCGSWT